MYLGYVFRIFVFGFVILKGKMRNLELNYCRFV